MIVGVPRRQSAALQETSTRISNVLAVPVVEESGLGSCHHPVSGDAR